MGNKLLHKHVTHKSISDSLIIDNIILHSSSDTIYFKDRESKFILHNGGHLSHFKVNGANDLVGKTDFDFFSYEEAKSKREDEIKIMETGLPLKDMIEETYNAEGKLVYFSVSKYPLFDYDGNIIGTWGISSDVTDMIITEQQLALANQKLTALSIIDNLTGLYNHRHFINSLDITMKRYERKKSSGLSGDFCLVLLDADHFKNINDTYGHVTGDKALGHIASILKTHTRTTDIIFRHGGDEFAVILHDTNLENGKIYGELIRKQIEITPLITDKDSISITMSIGVAVYTNEKTTTELVSKSDRQLYKGKKDGRNRVR